MIIESRGERADEHIELSPKNRTRQYWTTRTQMYLDLEKVKRMDSAAS